ncbi:small, acid-soluble spore protein, alpha/beta type [Filibacter tadaridae]|uniref:Small, acid-soluble spore protein C2 n=1 Tax=Filibacter tadaridae TaxID=2483811 RepID=A0A3P5XE90_9BACL|nr:small, acid-soluble spore protein, alpha/beta type [Filibacter tadaridae]VDC29657.1 Small, acid-soluble spore protein C2 [Filibacter tadaridae]
MAQDNQKSMAKLKEDVMKAQGYDMTKAGSDKRKFEIADELGIPLSNGYNGKLTAEQAGKIGGPIGGPIGGNMVKEMVRMAQEEMAKK